MKSLGLRLVSASALLLLWGCAPSGGGAHRVVTPTHPSQSLSKVGYDKVKPIFMVCASCHHAGGQSPDWTVYSQATPLAGLNGELKRRLVTEKTMPPVGSFEASQITDADRQLVASWIASGAPETSAGPTPQPPVPNPGGETPTAVQACIGCHGVDGMGQSGQAKVPRLAGMPEAYLVAQLSAFKWRTRVDPSNTMNEQAINLSNEDIQEVAKYFAALPAYALVLPIQVIPPNKQEMYNAGKAQADMCISCHLAPGVAPAPGMPIVPTLNAQQANYLFEQLVLLRSKIRLNDMMNGIASGLKDEDIANLSYFFNNSSLRNKLEQPSSTISSTSSKPASPP